ncbi:MAG: ribulose-phosphate 3-epimerase [Anaerolineaceae bacterium]|nr:ribulose-phosphate 3-epimerase [Anaerolineaceae bacterium]
MNIVIAPSILSADFTRLGEQIHEAQAAGASWIHVDVMDGHFVPNISMGPVITQACRAATELPLDVHLMIEQPERHLEAFARAGASRMTVHVETCPHLYRTLQCIRELGCLPGVSLNPGTPASSLEAILHLVDLVLVMTVSPGFGGQEYLEPVTVKIREIRRALDKISSPTWLEVDGGIAADTISTAYAAGARAFVAGTSIFKHSQGIAAGIHALRDAVHI